MFYVPNEHLCEQQNPKLGVTWSCGTYKRMCIPMNSIPRSFCTVSQYAVSKVGNEPLSLHGMNYVNTHCVYFLFAWNAFPVYTAYNARTCKDIPNFGSICSDSSFCEHVNTCVVKHRILINLLYMCTFACMYVCMYVHTCICALF